VLKTCSDEVINFPFAKADHLVEERIQWDHPPRRLTRASSGLVTSYSKLSGS
jgi:hypothetical protein